jgi:hypothetical protein
VHPGVAGEDPAPPHAKGRILAIWAKLQSEAVSTCIHCGQTHIASLRICPKTGKPLAASGQVSQKTLFGVGPLPTRPPPPASPKPGAAEAAPPKTSPAASSPTPPKTSPAASSPTPPKTSPAASSSAPPKTAPAASSSAPPKTAPAPPPPPAPGPPPAKSVRLPTPDEARDDPNLVISLDDTPPAGLSIEPAPPPKPKRIRGETPRASAAAPAAALPPRPESPASAAPDSPLSGQAATNDAPVDLPPAGTGGRFALPMPEDETARRTPPESSRTVRDAKAVFGMLSWAVGNYLRHPKQFLLLAALVVLPAAIVESCLLAAAAPVDAAALSAMGSSVDFSARKAELAARIRESQARGALDKQATAELAALTSVETALLPVAQTASTENASGLRARLAGFIQGFLLLGLALPLALAALALVTVDQQAGLALPSFADVWPIIAARAELLLVSLLPAALLVALGHALYVVPGLLLGALFIFLPHVVVFERRGGRAALARSVELLRIDARRAVFAFLVLGLAGFLAAELAHLLFPPTGSRAVLFVHFLLADLLALVVLPVPAMVLARLYLDIRARTGSVADRLSRAARS